MARRLIKFLLFSAALIVFILPSLFFTRTATADERPIQPPEKQPAPLPSDTVHLPSVVPDVEAENCAAPVSTRVLLAGDSWAQYMWDDDSHNDIFDRFGQGDKRLVSRSLGSDPGPGYTGPEYAVSGSEARQWANAGSYPWIANMVAELNAYPDIDTVVLSVGGNDILAGKSDGGWYKDMDLDNPGSEAALFAQIESHTWQTMNAALAVRPEMQVLVSSYDYPNFDVNFLVCWIYACPKRDDLSRDPVGDLITNAELNGMMSTVEQQRIGWTNSSSRIMFDNSLGLTHYFYGDGVSGPGVLPYPGQTAPDYLPFPAGNPFLPNLRETFRSSPDPIHLDYDSYQYKISNQMQSYFLPHFRGTPSMTFFSQGGAFDGWSNGITMGTDGVYMGDDGSDTYYGILSFDTAALPDRAVVTDANIYMLRDSASSFNPFVSGDLGTPTVDVMDGTFGLPAVEVGDATAVATATNAGCLHGSVKEDDYAIRVDLTADGLAAINDKGRTQFRFSFPDVDFLTDLVIFKDGDSALALREIEYQIKTEIVPLPDGTTQVISRTVAALPLPNLADYMGTAKPFLDVDYCLMPETAVVTPSLALPDFILNWTAADATEYEVWSAINDPYYTPATSCDLAANCTVVPANMLASSLGVGDVANNITYFIVARNACAGGSSAAASNRVAEFDFGIVAGG